MVRVNSSPVDPSRVGMVRSPLTMEQHMLIRTLREKQRPMSAVELTNHWMPTWSLREVNKFLHGLARAGHVQSHGREIKRYSITTHEADTKASSI
jgi:hypothetical protein